MKKQSFIILTIALSLSIIACGKEKSGTKTISNQTDDTITFGVGQNWTTKEYELAKNGSIDIEWKKYCLVYILKPERGVVQTATNNTISFEKIKPLYECVIRNYLINTPLSLVDGGYFLYADESSEEQINTVTVAALKDTSTAYELQEKKLKVYKEIEKNDIRLLTTDTISHGGQDYPLIEKENNDYYIRIKVEKNGSTYLKRKKLNIDIDDKIENNKTVFYISLYTESLELPKHD